MITVKLIYRHTDTFPDDGDNIVNEIQQYLFFHFLFQIVTFYTFPAILTDTLLMQNFWHLFLIIIREYIIKFKKNCIIIGPMPKYNWNNRPSTTKKKKSKKTDTDDRLVNLTAQLLPLLDSYKYVNKNERDDDACPDKIIFEMHI